MKNTRSLRRAFAGALVSATVALSSLALATGTAEADNQGPYQWCPGQDMAFPPGPGRDMIWDMNICHTFWFVDYGKGNVPRDRPGPPGPWVWDGPNPPPSNRCYPWCL